MRVSKSSAALPPSRLFLYSSRGSLLAVVTGLALLVTLSAWWFFHRGYILYYGDAESHLNISRGLIDSRTTGYDQLGTVWLPVLHLICIPFVRYDSLWITGLAGTIPVAICFVVAGTFFFLTLREAYANTAAALIGLLCFVLNPNILYLAVIPMTEIVFMASLFAILYTVYRFEASQNCLWIVLAVPLAWALSLTRYDGWFLLPFLGAWFAFVAQRRRLIILFTFGAAVSLAPLYWIAHNWWETGNALDFINGPYSPVAIQKGAPYPGYEDWTVAAQYYFNAGRLCAGIGLVALGVAGAWFAYRRRLLLPFLFLLLTPLFYLWSMHSSGGSPIHVPSLWPFSYYNTRYGIALVPLCAFAAGALALSLPPSSRKFLFVIPALAVLPWLVHPSEQRWICWKESQVNSVDRRAWTMAGARFFRTNYQPGQTILASAGDVTGIFRVAGIHLTATLNIANGPNWLLASTRPDLYHPGSWLVCQSDDSLSRSLAKHAAPYSLVKIVSTSRYSPDLLISSRHLP